MPDYNIRYPGEGDGDWYCNFDFVKPKKPEFPSEVDLNHAASLIPGNGYLTENEDRLRDALAIVAREAKARENFPSHPDITNRILSLKAQIYIARAAAIQDGEDPDQNAELLKLRAMSDIFFTRSILEIALDHRFPKTPDLGGGHDGNEQLGEPSNDYWDNVFTRIVAGAQGDTAEKIDYDHAFATMTPVDLTTYPNYADLRRYATHVADGSFLQLPRGALEDAQDIVARELDMRRRNNGSDEDNKRDAYLRANQYFYTSLAVHEGRDSENDPLAQAATFMLFPEQLGAIIGERIKQFDQTSD